ncbi:asparaginase domain-containing protein [Nitratifractor salsuginis]|uniref:Asparaginase/glutaminase n=1 Tax=Nitratifractor salsuginis (strain DSM 16511 / JCM 12458 / E9I37-1) TaxID=749222 RepID=E6WZ81_NITSE|nr:asparaginase domain-containing protein [Nitratifractor salsuginis]ADV46593.1 Asparaginase/glutaminase [Nitratifractor salsuginis DSM 16511]
MPRLSNPLEGIAILSTGGTFNKIYDPIAGELRVDPHSQAVQELLKHWKCQAPLINIIGKDSLEMNEEDRRLLAQTVQERPERKILIVHGTDTMDLSGAHLARHCPDRQIVLAGAMIPYSIDPVEATANFASAIGWLLGNDAPGVFIAMHGLVLPYDRIVKDREKGIFVHKA